MNKLRSAIIGCGAIAREHLAALANLGTAEVVGVCDISPVRAEAIAERFQIPRWYTNHKNLLAEAPVDIVHITTPPSSHFSIAKDCLAAGTNVFCEKPLTVRYSEFCELRDMARSGDRMLMENQQNRFHSSIKQIEDLIKEGDLGDVLEVQICLTLDITGRGSAYVDENAPHFGLALPGGVIGDFLPHMAYLAYIFTGNVVEVDSIWSKHKRDSPLPADEFRGLIKGERATAYLSFSGNAQPDAFLVRVVGTRMRVEVNLYEPPRLTKKRRRSGEPAVMTVIDGLIESRDVLSGTLAGFARKLAGTSSYDGMEEMIRRTYQALEERERQPISLDEIDRIAQLVDRLGMAVSQ